MPNLQPDQLEQFAARLLSSGGCSEREAQRVAESLVGANLRGYDSHGVMRIPYYVQALAEGEMVSGAEFSVESESATRLVADANWGIGQVQAAKLLSELAAKAKTEGLAVGTMTHSGHIGRLGE